MNDGSQAAHKLTQSISKQIENIVIAERPFWAAKMGPAK